MALDSGPGQNRSGGPFSGQPPFKLIGGLVVVVAIAVLVAVAASGGGGDGGSGSGGEVGSKPATSTPRSENAGLASPGTQPIVEATINLQRPTAVPPVALQSVASGDRLVLPKFGISGQLSIKAVGADGVMPDPTNPDEIAYYDFSAFPGMGGTPGRGGNAVFSGHVDSGFKPCQNGTVPPPCTAILWELRNVRIGDEIEVHLSAAVYRYRVTANQHFTTSDAPWNQIVATTAQETVTIITCTGEFRSGEYNSRQVVTAIRIL